MAGKGSEIGRSFEELRELLDRVELQEKVGVCLDTCHVFDSGYDIVNDLDGVLNKFDQAIGLSRLKAVHLNDSIFGLGSHKDRHARIGEGKIGKEGIVRIINHPVLRKLPFLLPFCWIARLFRGMLRRRKQIAREYRFVRHSGEEKR